jgi:hypothetical protein
MILGLRSYPYDDDSMLADSLQLYAATPCSLRVSSAYRSCCITSTINYRCTMT